MGHHGHRWHRGERVPSLSTLISKPSPTNQLIAFCKDLLTNPSTRDVTDVAHEIVAVASSSSADRAVDFIKKIDGPSSAATYGSYAELVADSKVDIIYVATPHSHHFQNTMLCLEAGKHVLCEKAFTVNASQAKKLIEKAKAKNLFLMEAVWTRYFPLSIKVRELITSGAIGTVYRTLCKSSSAPCSHSLTDNCSRPQLQQEQG